MARFVGQVGYCFDRLAVERCCCKHVNWQPASGTDLDGLVLRHDRGEFALQFAMTGMACDHAAVRIHANTSASRECHSSIRMSLAIRVPRLCGCNGLPNSVPSSFHQRRVRETGWGKKCRLDMDRLPRGRGILDKLGDLLPSALG